MNGFIINGLDELERHLLKKMMKEMPEEVERKLQEIAWKLFAKVVPLTPTGETSRLKGGWTVADVTKQGEEWFIVLGNNVDYSKHVEYGHRTRDKKGFVQGAHMLEISIAQLEKELPNDLKTWLHSYMLQ